MKMAQKLLSLSLLAVPLASYASLPDEINFKPYEIKYEAVTADVNALSSTLQLSREDLTKLLTEENNNINQTRELEIANSTLGRELEETEDDIISLENRSDEIIDDIDRLNKNERNLVLDQNQIQRDMQREVRRLAPLKTRLVNLSNKLTEKNRELSRVERSLDRVTTKTRSLKNEWKKLVQEKEALKTQISNLENKLTKIDTLISTAESKHASMDAKISTQKSEVNSISFKVNSLNAEKDAIKAELDTEIRTDRASAKVRELRAKLARKSRAIKAEEAKLAEAKTRLASLKSKKSSLANQIAKLKSDKGTLPAQILRKTNELKTKRAFAQTKKAEYESAHETKLEKEEDLREVLTLVNSLNRRIRNAEDTLNRESRVLANLQDDEAENARAIEKTRSDLRVLDQNLRQVSLKIDDLEDDVVRINNTVTENNDDIVTLKRNLQGIKTDIRSTENTIRQNEVELQVAEDDQAVKLREFKVRENLYLEKLQDAKSLGISQTGEAVRKGQVDGLDYMALRSNNLGSDIGKNLFNAQASLWGSVRAELNGYADGYVIGSASDADIERGRIEGALLGEREARDYANMTLKPEFFTEYYYDLLGQKSAHNMIELNSTDTAVALELQTLAMAENLGVDPITVEELQNSRELETSLDQLIETNVNVLTTSTASYETAKGPSNSYEDPKDIPFGAVNCDGVYKNVAEFTESCKNSYAKSFEAKYLENHFNTFKTNFTDKFVDKVELVIEDNIQEAYSDVYDSVYPVAKDIGIANGKKDIFAKTFKEAQKRAYAKEIVPATEVAKVDAKNELSVWVKDNATLKLGSSSIINSTLIGGASGTLRVKVNNISPTDLIKPVKVVITSSENVSLSKKEYLLKKAKGSQLTNFDDIKFTINKGLRSGRRVKLSGKIYLSGGKYKAQRVETFSAQATSEVNPAVSTRYAFSTTPRIITRFRRRTLIHNFDITASPSVENIRSGYTVTLKPMRGYENMIRMKNTQAVTGSMSAGTPKVFRFQYTFPISSRNKQVKLEASYSYKGKVIKKEILELRPF